MTAKGNTKTSGYERAANDWYVEDDRCVASLFDAMPWFRQGGLHDPCCGNGTIPRVATARWIRATGADLIDRAAGKYPARDYLADDSIYPAIVTNPPFSIAEEIVRHALQHVDNGGYVAIIAQAKFLYSQARHPLFTMPECDRVLILSRRPSMPPGEMLAEKGESCRGGGFHDFCWVVWRVGKMTPGATIGWLP